MKTTHQVFETGWIGLSLAMGPDEIDSIIALLEKLKAGSISHFHLTQQTWVGECGVADIEISVKGEDDADDMRVG